MDFSMIPKSAKKQQTKSKKATVVTVSEVREEKRASRDLFSGEAGREWSKWFKRYHKNQAAQQMVCRAILITVSCFMC